MVSLGHCLKGTEGCVALGVPQGHGREGSQRAGQAGMGWVGTGGIYLAARGAGGCAHPRTRMTAQPPLRAPTILPHSKHSLSLLQAVSYCLSEVAPKSWPQGSAWDAISAHDFIPGDHSQGSCLRELPQHQGSSQSVRCGHLSPAASSANIHPRGTPSLSSSCSPAYPAFFIRRGKKFSGKVPHPLGISLGGAEQRAAPHRRGRREEEEGGGGGRKEERFSLSHRGAS